MDSCDRPWHLVPAAGPVVRSVVRTLGIVTQGRLCGIRIWYVNMMCEMRIGTLQSTFVLGILSLASGAVFRSPRAGSEENPWNGYL